MPKPSAGLLMYRWNGGELEVLLAHPGGPLFARKDAGVWTLPKGQIDPGEDPLDAARREFEEETGFPAEGEFLSLGDIRLRSGKVVSAWAFQGECDPAALRSNPFQMEWPPRSGRIGSFREVDRAGWFTLPQAKLKLSAGQHPFLVRLKSLLAEPADG